MSGRQGLIAPSQRTAMLPFSTNGQRFGRAPSAWPRSERPCLLAVTRASRSRVSSSRSIRGSETSGVHGEGSASSASIDRAYSTWSRIAGVCARTLLIEKRSAPRRCPSWITSGRSAMFRFMATKAMPSRGTAEPVAMRSCRSRARLSVTSGNASHRRTSA